MTANDLRGLVRSGSLVRVRHGSYVDGPRFGASGAVERHQLAARAVALSLPQYAVSHLSAVALWGLPVLEVDLGPVHLSGVGSSRARRGDGVRFHPPVPPGAVNVHDGIRMVGPALAVMQSAAVSGVRAALIAADAGLRTRAFELPELRDSALWQPRPRAARRVLELASAASESAGESWCRLVFADLGLTQPLQQQEICDERGEFVARVDFLFAELRLIVEFDGGVKYEGPEGRRELIKEKRREDALRHLGYRVVRIGWRDLADPERVARLLSFSGATR